MELIIKGERNSLLNNPNSPGKERKRDDNEPEYKWERKRKFNALREDCGKEDSEIRNLQFGIEVSNVRGIKCHELGLINTDKECKIYNQVMSAHPAETSLDSFDLLQQRKKFGLAMEKRGLRF